MKRIVFLGLAVAWAGCEAAAPSAPGVGISESDSDASPAITVDTPSVDVPAPPETPDPGPQDTSTEPLAGQFLAPCDDNADCDSQLCVTHLGGQVCSKACVDDCPAG